MGKKMKAKVNENGETREERVVLITGAYGFIGSNLVKLWMQEHHNDKIILLDGMTYAARPKYIKDFIEEQKKHFNPDVVEAIVDIQDQLAVARIMQKYKPDIVVHLAAESHVCRSISGPKEFVHTNVVGTFNLIEEFYQLHKENLKNPSLRFIHVSTDEVFGELETNEPPFSETTNIQPRSPYAASKAASDHIVQSFFHTYGVPTIITNCSNNYGPNQHEEKLIPATIKRILEGKPAILHGNGRNVRDWLFVEEHCQALSILAEKGVPGERYCIGGEHELQNIEVVESIYKQLGKEVNIEFSNDRPTDDKRYAIDCEKLRELGWAPTIGFQTNLYSTIKYYLAEWGRVQAEAVMPSTGEGVFGGY